MLVQTPPAPRLKLSSARRKTLKSTRPALTDLRFKGDMWVVERGQVAAVCLGDYPLGYVAVSPLVVPTLNRVLSQLRVGQARRNLARRKSC